MSISNSKKILKNNILENHINEHIVNSLKVFHKPKTSSEIINLQKTIPTGKKNTLLHDGVLHKLSISGNIIPKNINKSIISKKKVKYPNFLIIGAQKGGTVSAVINLNKHPDIFVHKEIHYFDIHYNKKKSWYYSLFNKSNKKIRGEKTPELIYVDKCPERIKKTCPDAKFILFLRDPIKRAYSNWNMNVQESRENRTFEECVDANLKNLDEVKTYKNSIYHYVQKGFYIEQIIKFLSILPNKDNLLIIISEKLRSNPEEEYKKIYDFLGVKNINIDYTEEHVRTYENKISKKMENKLKNIYKTHNQMLFKFLGYNIPEWK